MLKIYNPTQRILIVKNKKGKIVKAYGGDLATQMWYQHLQKFAINSIN